MSGFSNHRSISVRSRLRSLRLVHFFEKPYHLLSAVRGRHSDLLIYSQAASQLLIDPLRLWIRFFELFWNEP